MGMVIEQGGMNWEQEEPTAALYRAALRSLARARQCIADDDSIGRIMEVKKVTDILTCLQATLRTGVSRSAALSLSEFYAAMFTLTLEASQCESTEGLDEVIGCVTRVRDAWELSRGEPKASKVTLQAMRPHPLRSAAMLFHA